MLMEGSWDLLVISGKRIRRFRDDKEGEWLYSLTDVIAYIVDSKDPVRYLYQLRSNPKCALYYKRKDIVVKFPIKVDDSNTYLNCSNLAGLYWVFKAIPKKYEGRKRWIKTWIS